MSSHRIRVALTFDAEHAGQAHWRPDGARRILKALELADVPASFFVQGRWAASNPEIARQIAAAGHLIGNHSHFHAAVRHLSTSGLRHDVTTATETIRNIAGVDPRPWFRCPYGDGADDAQVLANLATLGYRHVHWNVDSHDWMETNTARDVAANVLDGVSQVGDGAIVLMHTWPSTTARALPRILDKLQAINARFVTVGELVDVVDAA